MALEETRARFDSAADDAGHRQGSCGVARVIPTAGRSALTTPMAVALGAGYAQGLTDDSCSLRIVAAQNSGSASSSATGDTSIRQGAGHCVLHEAYPLLNRHVMARLERSTLLTKHRS